MLGFAKKANREIRYDRNGEIVTPTNDPLSIKIMLVGSSFGTFDKGDLLSVTVLILNV